MFDYRNLGWWLGHGFELVGIALVGGAVAFDLYRGSGMSRPLVGDLRAVELVTQEEAFLGSHVRALLVSLAEKDASTEEHTRRVALRAVEVGEELGLPAPRLRGLALGGLLHDMGKLAVPGEVLRKPGALTTTSSSSSSDIRRPVSGSCATSAGSPTRRSASCDITTSGSTARATRTASAGTRSTSTPGSSPSATSTTRSSRPACTARRGATSARSRCCATTALFDQRCVEALERVVGRERASGLAVAVYAPNDAAGGEAGKPGAATHT